MSFLRGLDDSDPVRSDPIGHAAGTHEKQRRVTRSGWLASGTLACSRCDAPVAVGAAPLSLTDRLGCPFCSHSAPVRDFLSIRVPTRPARVEVWIVDRTRPAVR